MDIQQKRFRLEIEGVRAVAALLVAIYHIWLNRVSGGVDVFFTISGFLITTSLLSRYRRGGNIRPFSYIVRLLKRLIPSAWFIAISTFILSLIFLPASTKPQYFTELVASLFYFENWRLAFDSVDYLAQNNTASIYQHYWALSIQFQFYICWLLLFSLAMFMKRMVSSLHFNKIILYMLIVVAVTSLAYSVYLTGVNQPFAYYHTFTRIWEFSLGGILALTIHKVKFPRIVAWFSGWIGLIALLLCGVVLQVSTVFPGYMALWPTGAAILILLAGNQSTRFSAYQLLSSKPLVSFGKVSYAFYLWHWPILVIYLNYFQMETVSIPAGVAIIILSVVLAYFTIYCVEKPVREADISKRKTAISLALLLLITSVTLYTYYEKDIRKQLTIPQYDENFGVLSHILEEEAFYYEEESLHPPIEQSRFDLSNLYGDGCFQDDSSAEVISCEYGETEDYSHTIALVGGSHAAQWKPMLHEYGLENKVRITTMLKANCRFSTEDTSNTPNCVDWFFSAKDILVTEKPDLIFTIGDVSSPHLWDEIPPGFEEAWSIFEKEDISLFLLRDNPRFDYNVSDCLNETTGNLIDECRQLKSETISEVSALESSDKVPGNAFIFDVTDFLCDEEYCYPIVGNVVSYFDSNHITASLAKSFLLIFEDALNDCLVNQGVNQGDGSFRGQSEVLR